MFMIDEAMGFNVGRVRQFSFVVDIGHVRPNYAPALGVTHWSRLEI